MLEDGRGEVEQGESRHSGPTAQADSEVDVGEGKRGVSRLEEGGLCGARDRHQLSSRQSRLLTDPNCPISVGGEAESWRKRCDEGREGKEAGGSRRHLSSDVDELKVRKGREAVLHAITSR